MLLQKKAVCGLYPRSGSTGYEIRWRACRRHGGFLIENNLNGFVDGSPENQNPRRELRRSGEAMYAEIVDPAPRSGGPQNHSIWNKNWRWSCFWHNEKTKNEPYCFHTMQKARESKTKQHKHNHIPDYPRRKKGPTGAVWTILVRRLFELLFHQQEFHLQGFLQREVIHRVPQEFLRFLPLLQFEWINLL